MSIRTSLVALAALAAASPAAAQETAPDTAADIYTVKVSVNRDDPNVHGGSAKGEGPYDFFLFVDGAPARGAEFGIEIEGGSLVAYIIDPDNPWVALPMANPYPGTVAQVKAGKDCYDAPVYFGKMMVQPDTPGGPVELRVVPSVRASQAVILRCDNSGQFGFQGTHAALNKKPAAASRVEGATHPSQVPHDHDGDGVPDH